MKEPFIPNRKVYRNYSGSYIVVAGNVVDGYNHHGPFDSKEAAENYKKERQVLNGVLVRLQLLEDELRPLTPE